MKTKYVLILAALLLAMPAWAQPVPEPKAKAPVAKAVPKAPVAKAVPKAPVAKKAAPKAVAKKAAPKAAEPVVTPEMKVEGKVELVEPVVEEKKAEEPVVAPVVGAEEKGYGGVVATHAIKLGFTLLSLLLSALVFVLLKKFGFEAQNSKVQDVLVKASGFAEQWSLKQAKLEGEAKPGGPAKMDKALTFALDMATEYKLPQKGKDWWENQLEGWLGVKNGG